MTEQLDAALAQAMQWSSASGGIAGVWAPWAGEWTSAQGVSSADGKTPVSTGMHFRSAASDRAMACTVMLRLADAGELSVSDSVSKYLPDMPGTEGITLGQLCQGTSGLADYSAQFGSLFVNNPKRNWSNMELVSAGLASTKAAPGASWQDSATPVALLGMALSAHTGKSWSDLYSEQLFGPLGLSETSQPDAGKFEIRAPSLHGYAAQVKADGTRDCAAILDETNLSPSQGGAAGGIISTLEDQKTWAQSLADGRLLSGKSSKAQLSTIPLGGDAPSWQGYGLGVQKIGPLVGHNGAIPGFLTAAYADPLTGFTVVVMLNNSTAGKGFAQQLAMQLASIGSKAAAASGETAPAIELPWSAEQAAGALQAGAVCQAPVEAAAG
ncbi:serine hydrolase domain-containing protein [Microterricola viridarii]|uniref:serine hydrolase domain-containing protein n=1 Tax=Microterricola viridarii TaxID=412690 RepID=UPI00101AD800|nr:serine hydrolase domain-containing protein [Microterricola viridarii]